MKIPRNPFIKAGLLLLLITAAMGIEGLALFCEETPGPVVEGENNDPQVTFITIVIARL